MRGDPDGARADARAGVCVLRAHELLPEPPAVRRSRNDEQLLTGRDDGYGWIPVRAAAPADGSGHGRGGGDDRPVRARGVELLQRHVRVRAERRGARRGRARDQLEERPRVQIRAHATAHFNDEVATRGGGAIDGSPREDEHFVVWMRTAAMNDFRKLWGKIDVDLPKGAEVRVAVRNRYNSYAYGGSKSVALSTTSWLGGKNDFLGAAYLSVEVDVRRRERDVRVLRRVPAEEARGPGRAQLEQVGPTGEVRREATQFFIYHNTVSGTTRVFEHQTRAMKKLVARGHRFGIFQTGGTGLGSPDVPPRAMGEADELPEPEEVRFEASRGAGAFPGRRAPGVVRPFVRPRRDASRGVVVRARAPPPSRPPSLCRRSPLSPPRSFVRLPLPQAVFDGDEANKASSRRASTSSS